MPSAATASLATYWGCLPSNQEPAGKLRWLKHRISAYWRGILILVIRIKIPARLERVGIWLVLGYRRLRFGYAFRKIPLTQGRYAIVDPDDYASLAKYKWRICRTKSKNVSYAERSIRLSSGRYSRILMHRQLIDVPEGYVIDHINGSGLDNRRANLRLATVAQNAWNSKKRNSRSGYKGVWFARDKGLWRAAIVCNRRRIHLGYFRDKYAAARAYDTAARIYFGEYAVLNFPSHDSPRPPWAVR